MPKITNHPPQMHYHQLDVLALRIQLLWNGLRQSPVGATLGLLLALGLMVGAWAGVLWFLNFISSQLLETYKNIPFGNKLAEATKQVVADRSLASLLLLLSTASVLSAVPNAVTVLYTSEDLPLHLALPQRAAKVFLFKVSEVFASTSLIPALFTIPVMIAFGQHYHSPPLYFILMPLIVLALFGFPVVVGVGLALPLVRYAPAGRAREWAAALGAVLGGLLIFVLRALRPEALLKTDFSSPEALDKFLQTFRDPSSPFLPSALAQKALDKLMDGRISPEFYGLIGLSGGLLLVAGLVAGYAYQQGWVRALEGTVRERGILRPGLLDRVSGWGMAWALWVRDLRLFFRDANQASQLILVAVLILIYTTSLQYMPVDNPVFRNITAFLHLAFQGFVIGGVGVRLAFPLYSLEGQGYWLIQTGPVSRATMLLTRFGLALFLLLPLGLILGWYSPRILGLDTNLTAISVLLGLASAITVAGLGVGLGAAHPKLDAPNPAEIAIGLGGFVYMGLSLLHSTLLVVLAARPVWAVLRLGNKDYLGSPEGAIWLVILAIVTLIPTALALAYGYRRLGTVQ